MPQYFYMPFLRTKAGEVTALRNLSSSAASRVFPVFHVVENPKASFINSLSQIWTGRLMYLDGQFNFNATGLIADFAAVYTALGAAGVKVCPSIEVNGPMAYTSAVIPLLNQYSSGLLLRSTPANLQYATSVAHQLGLQPKQVDLVLDAGHIAGADVPTFAGYLSSVIPGCQPHAWRSVTLTGSSAPKDFGDLALGTAVIPRVEWLVWQAVIAQQPLINFGDHSVAHRDLTEAPGYAMSRATVSVRYTIDDNWVMIKGRSISGQKGIPMPQQYLQHAKSLSVRQDFNKLPSCWADGVILAISQGSHSPGNRPQWVGYGHNRHLELVCDRLP